MKNIIKRFFANTVNLLIVFNIAVLVYSLLFMRGVFEYPFVVYILHSLQTFTGIIILPVALWGKLIPGGLALINNIEMTLMVLCIMLFIDVAMSILFKADIGKLIFRMKITSVNGKNNIFKIMLRYLLKYVFAFTLPLLLLIPFNIGSKKSFIHEKISKTLIDF